MTSEPHSRPRARRASIEHDNEPLMDINKLAAFLNSSVGHMRRLVQEQRLPHYKIGGKLRFSRRETRDWLASVRVPARDPTVWPIHPRRRRASSG
jgi:excisionase family DNA binding protein